MYPVPMDEQSPFELASLSRAGITRHAGSIMRTFCVILSRQAVSSYSDYLASLGRRATIRRVEASRGWTGGGGLIDKTHAVQPRQRREKRALERRC